MRALKQSVESIRHSASCPATTTTNLHPSPGVDRLVWANGFRRGEFTVSREFDGERPIRIPSTVRPSQSLGNPTRPGNPTYPARLLVAKRPLVVTSGHPYLTPLRPVVPRDLTGLSGVQFGWVSQCTWDIPHVIGKCFGTSQSDFQRDIPPAVGGPEFFFWDIPWTHFTSQTPGTRRGKNRIFAPVSAPFWLPLGDPESDSLA